MRSGPRVRQAFATTSVTYRATRPIIDLRRYTEAKSLLLKTIPMSRRVPGDNEGLSLHIRMNYALALYADTRASLDDVREAVTALGNWTGPRGACLAARTRTQRGLRALCATRRGRASAPPRRWSGPARKTAASTRRGSGVASTKI